MRLILFMAVLVSSSHCYGFSDVEKEIRKYLDTAFHNIKIESINIFTGGSDAMGKRDIEIEFLSVQEPDVNQKPLLLNKMAFVVSYMVYYHVLHKYPEFDALTISRRTQHTSSKEWISFYLLENRLIYDSSGRMACNSGNWRSAFVNPKSYVMPVPEVTHQIKEAVNTIFKSPVITNCRVEECTTFRSQTAGLKIAMDLNTDDPSGPNEIKELGGGFFSLVYQKVLAQNPFFSRVVFKFSLPSGKQYTAEYYIVGKDFLYSDQNGHFEKCTLNCLPS